MRDSTMQPDIALQMRRLNQRIEALEMSQRSARTPQTAVMFAAPGALAPPVGLAPQGQAGMYTDQPGWTDLWYGDFIAVGYKLSGSMYHWISAGSTMDMRVKVVQAGATAQVVYTQTGITAGGQGGNWEATIPPSAVYSDDIRGVSMRIGVSAKLTAGTLGVGMSIDSVPVNSP